MLPHQVPHRDVSAGLSVDLGIDVVLIGFEPVFTHGLYVGLTATGLRCTTLASTDRIASSVTAGRTAVAVVPAGTSTGETADGAPLPAVHVLAEASAQAYSEALRAGATGAFSYDAELPDIVRIVLCAGLGLTLLPVDVARALNRRSVGSRPQLTGHDLQYLRLLAGGATVASVGRRFAHSEREMYRLLTGTYQRLGARNRTDALLLAERFDLLKEEP